ncbi:MAG: hypothetical protein HQL95_15920, partial [Magnetococcales bacterium]|nr:hypothetical protein [Magnetococcales bacterium]
TRGRDGLDEGYAEARKNAENFRERLPAFLAVVQQSGHAEWMRLTASLEERFEAFHTKGQTMAAAYIQGGAKQGNPLMAEFDTMADDLERELTPFITPAMEDASSGSFQIDLVFASLQEIRKALFFLIFLALIAAIGSLAWLSSCKTRL